MNLDDRWWRPRNDNSTKWKYKLRSCFYPIKISTHILLNLPLADLYHFEICAVKLLLRNLLVFNSKKNIMKTDSKIKIDVQDELSWEPSIDETKIGVTVDNGIVTLSGKVDSYAKKIAAEEAAKRVHGVKAVAEDIEVGYANSNKPNDTEIAKAAVNAIKWDTSIPEGKVMVKVENNWVYLSGEVNWDYQKDSAKLVVQNLNGVRGVINSIKLKSEQKTKDIKRLIGEALKRSATIDSNNVKVWVEGDTVTLTGNVNSIKEKEDAQRAAYLAPGVCNVKNNLKVEPKSVYA